MTATNEFGQPIGTPLPNWRPALQPSATKIPGHRVSLELLNAERHAADLFQAYSSAADGSDWTYLSIGPFDDFDTYRSWIIEKEQSLDPRHYAVIDHDSGQAIGTLALMRHDLKNGSIEVGFVIFSPLLQRSAKSTETHYLLMKYVFDELGFRRYEWKCDSLNEPSKRAARRLGFQYEGTFRQAVVYKGRSRDTEWFSILDGEWPKIRTAFEAWLDPQNFDEDGKQISQLSISR